MKVTTRSLAILVALFTWTNAHADEQRCNDLGSACVCNEPLNTNKHSGGSTDSSALYQNPDDSSPAKSCGSYGVYYNQGGAPVAAGSVPFNLPPGNDLNYVYNNYGGGNGKIEHTCNPPGGWNANSTHCTRAYRRFGNTPGTCSDGQCQTKILDMGGYNAATGFYHTWQISWGGKASSMPVNLRFDGTDFDCGGRSGCQDEFTGIVENNCIDNFCRFEICMDWNPSGNAALRYRIDAVAPSSAGSLVDARIPATGWSDGSLSTFTMDEAEGSCAKQLGFWGGSFAPDSWNSHGLRATVSPMNQSFWIGPACEVEGACDGVIPPDPPAAPQPPVLLP